MKKNIFSLALALSLGAALMFVTSCSKEDKIEGGSAGHSQERTKAKINQFIKQVRLHNLTNQLRTRSEDATVRPLEFSFADPSSGYTYSNTSTYSTLVGTTYSTISYTVYSAYNSFGAGTGGGTVVAGPSSLDINYAFCFSSEDAGFGLGLIGTGAPTGGISSVIGISGDFSALENANDSTDLADVFHGLAFYFVYDGTASGSYPVIDFSSIDWNDSTSVDNKCFAFIFDIQNGRFFVSKSGTINVTGGSMAYNGEYYMLDGFLNDDGEFDLDSPDVTLSVVSGFGAMGCN